MSAASCAFDVLIVEDEVLLAMDLEAMIEDEGHKIVGEAASLTEVENLDVGLAPDVAFVDIQLADDTSGLDVCALVKARWPQTAVVFVTANPGMLPEDFLGAHGVISKPFSRGGMLAALRFITQGIASPPPTLDLPASFVASPRIAKEWARA